MKTTVWTVMERVNGDEWIAVGTKPSERAAKLLRTRLRGDSDRDYQIIPFTVTGGAPGAVDVAPELLYSPK